MQRACSELEREGVLYTQRGVGSFVTEDETVIQSLKQEMCSGLVSDFITGMRGIGLTNKEIIDTVGKALQK